TLQRIMRPIAFVVLWLSLASVFAEGHWPQFRGPTGEGLAEGKLPLEWSEDRNVHWKAPIHGRAWSSPVVLEDQVWITTATEEEDVLCGVCVGLESGDLVHGVTLFAVAAPQFAHSFNSDGSHTPASEEGRVYITVGSHGTACLDAETGK